MVSHDELFRSEKSGFFSFLVEDEGSGLMIPVSFGVLHLAISYDLHIKFGFLLSVLEGRLACELLCKIETFVQKVYTGHEG